MQVASATMPTFITCASIWPKPAIRCAPGAVRNQDAGRPHHRIDDVADAQRELLDPPVDPGANMVLSRSTCASARAASALAFSAGAARELYLGDCLTRSRHRGSLDGPSTSTSSFSISRCGTMPGFRCCSSRLISSSSRPAAGALASWIWPSALRDFGLRRQHGGVDLGDLALRPSRPRPPAGAVEPEDRLPFFDGGTECNDEPPPPARPSRADGNGAKERRGRS